MIDDATPTRVPGPPSGGADEFDRLLIRYFSGQSTREDQRYLDRWLAEKAGRALELERLRHLWLRSAVETMDVPVNEALARFKARARREEGVGRSAGYHPVLIASARRRWSWVAVAAGLVLAVGAGFWWNQTVSHAARAAAGASATHLYATVRGQRATYYLPDGTQVTLAPSSTLEVPVNFGVGARDVRLTGLAFFAVAKDSSRPFRVHSGDGIAQVLGTKFSVRAGWGGEAGMQVVVTEGRVALRPAYGPPNAVIPESQVLTRGDLGSFSADGKVEVVRGVNLADRLGWVDGRLNFDRTPLPVVLRELETWFGVDFVIASPALRQAQLTTKFDNDSFSDMLRLLEAALGAKAEVTGKTVMLRVVDHSK